MGITDKNYELLTEYRETRLKPIQDKTFDNYIYIFEKVEDIIKQQNKDFKKIKVDTLIRDLRNSNLSVAVQLKFILIMKHIRDSEEFEKYTEELSNKLKAEVKTKTQKKLNTTITTFTDLTTLLNSGVSSRGFVPARQKVLKEEFLYPHDDKGNGITSYDYLLLFILLNYGVRNKDLIIDYTNDMNVIEGVLSGRIQKNIMFFDKSTLYYVRNDYKTRDRYGVLKIKITDKTFKSIVKKLDYGFIFNKRNGNSYEENEIGNLIKRTFNHYIEGSNLTEGIIYKIQVQHYGVLDNNKRLKQLAQTRPHTLGVQFSNYE